MLRLVLLHEAELFLLNIRHSEITPHNVSNKHHTRLIVSGFFHGSATIKVKTILVINFSTRSNLKSPETPFLIENVSSRYVTQSCSCQNISGTPEEVENAIIAAKSEVVEIMIIPIHQLVP